jgi:hypothetical protein
MDLEILHSPNGNTQDLYLKIKKDIVKNVLYDRNFFDIFVLAFKNDLNINSLSCF